MCHHNALAALLQARQQAQGKLAMNGPLVVAAALWALLAVLVWTSAASRGYVDLGCSHCVL